MANPDWVRLGQWEFQPGEVIAVHYQGDGSVKVHLGGGLVIPLGPDDAESFLADFGTFRTLKIPGRNPPPGAGADDPGDLLDGGPIGAGP